MNIIFYRIVYHSGLYIQWEHLELKGFKSLLCAGNYPKCFVYIISFNPPNSPVRQELYNIMRKLRHAEVR